MNTANRETAYGDIRIDRIERGEFGLSGNLVLEVDVTKDMEVEVLWYRSTDGGASYKIQPYSLPRQSIIDAMNNFYKDMVMPSAANCSNLPQIEDKLTMLPAQKFHFEKCQVSTERFPQHVPDGLYKMTFQTYGAVDLSCEIFVIIEKKPI